MRGLLVLLLLAAASAGADAEDALPKVVVEVAPWESPIPPGSAITEIPVEVVIDCALLFPEVSSQKTPVTVRVTDAPAWAIASVHPPEASAGPAECGGTTVTLAFALLVTLTADAPAFAPAEVRVRADVAGPAAASGEGATAVEAAYFPIVDATAATTVQEARPRSVVTFPVVVSNLGNGEMRVTFEADPPPEGWDLQTPLPVVLGSKQQGATETSETVHVNVLTARLGTTTNEVQAFTMRVVGAHADDPAHGQGSTTLSFLVTSRGFDAPAAGVVAAASAFASAAWIARRPR